MANRITRVPVREQDPKRRAANFEEVCYGYNAEEAMLEATRCLHCKNPRCVAACPVNVKIPDFIARVVEGDFAGAARVIAQDSSLPAVCGRVQYHRFFLYRRPALQLYSNAAEYEYLRDLYFAQQGGTEHYLCP